MYIHIYSWLATIQNAEDKKSTDGKSISFKCNSTKTRKT